jgi:hypothetical protein
MSARNQRKLNYKKQAESNLWIPDFHPKQQLFYDSPATEILWAGDTRGGKSAGVKLALIRWCALIPGLQCDIFRLREDDVISGYMRGDFSFPVLLHQWVQDKLVTMNQTEIKFWNGSYIELNHCFTGDTKIQTTEGIKTILELIGLSGYVNIAQSITTSFGYARKTRENAKVVKVVFDDGTEYRCTSDHKFITDKGLVEARNLQGKRCLTNESKLSAQQFKHLRASGIIYRGSISQTIRKDYIGLFGKVITEKFLKATKSTIKTKIDPIIRSRTCKCLKFLCIEKSMPTSPNTKSALKGEFNRTRCDKQKKNGTNQARGTNGIRGNILKLKLKGYSYLVLNVVQRFLASLITNIAVRNALHEYITRKKEVIKNLFANVVARFFQGQLETKHAAQNADTNYKHKLCLSVQDAGIEDVYCLTVPDYGFFPLSNGVLVSNCWTDAALTKHQGVPKHVRVIDEAGQIPERRLKWLKIWMTMSVDAKEKIPVQWREQFPKIIYLMNRLGPSRNYFKRTFVRKRPKYSMEKVGAFVQQYIPAAVNDNPSEDAELTKERVLEAADSATAKALLSEDGWDAQTGNYFDVWDSEKHVIKPFIIPSFWLRFRTFDYGSYEPWACVWWAVSPGVTIHEDTPHERYLPRGCLVGYREWYGCKAEHPDPRNPKDEGVTNLAPQGWSNKDIAEGVIERTEEQHDDQPTFTDRFPFIKLGGRSISHDFDDAGLHLSLGELDRKNRGAQTTSKLNGIKLIAGSDQHWPMMVFFDTCKYCQDYMPMIERHENEGRLWDYAEDGEATHIVDCVTLAAVVHNVVKDAEPTTAEVLDKSLKSTKNIRKSVRDIVPDLNI